MNRLMAAGLGLLAILAVGGCVKARTLVVVKPDGSGYLVFSQFGTGSSGMAYAMAQRGGKKVEEQLEELAEKFGDGVKLEKSEEVQGKGYAAVFSFTNVNQVAIPVMSMGPMGEMDPSDMGMAPAVFRQRIRFEFSRADASRLVVQMPAALVAAALAPADTNVAAKAGSHDGMSEMEEFAGMDMEVALQIDGQIVSHSFSSPFPDRADRFLLFRLDGEKLVAQPSALAMFGEEPPDPSAMDAYFTKFFQLCGAEVETNVQATIEFK